MKLEFMRVPLRATRIASNDLARRHGTGDAVAPPMLAVGPFRAGMHI